MLPGVVPRGLWVVLVQGYLQNYQGAVSPTGIWARDRSQTGALFRTLAYWTLLANRLK